MMETQIKSLVWKLGLTDIINTSFIFFWCKTFRSLLKSYKYLCPQTIEMIEKEQREAERRPITKITHKGEIEIESQEPIKAPEPVEVRNTSNINLLTVFLPVKECLLEFLFLPYVVRLSLLPEWLKSQQNLQKPPRRKKIKPRRRKTPPTNTSLTYLTYTAKSAQVNPENHLSHWDILTYNVSPSRD